MRIVLVAAAAAVASGPVLAAELALRSPNGQVVVTVSDGEGALRYALRYRGEDILKPSALGLDLSAGGRIGYGLKIVASSTESVDTSWTPVAGKASTARDRYNALTVDLAEDGPNGRKLRLMVRAYDDGLAFRYVLPQQPRLEGVDVRGELTRFQFAHDFQCWGVNFGRFGTSHEGEYDPLRTSALRDMHLLDAPLTCRTPKGAGFAVAEADLKDWPGLYLKGGGGNAAEVVLSPRLDDPGVAARTRIGSDVVSPWRVVMLAERPGDLIESTLIPTLNPPSIVADTSWIKPGKTTWDWWHGPVLKAVPNTGMTYETYRRFIDFAAANGVEYVTIDEGWYAGAGGGGVVRPGVDVLTPKPEMRLPELLEYAKARDVGLIVWVNWKALDAQMDEALPLYERWGIKGVKVDFMDRDDQEMVRWYHRLLRAAARHRLLVDLHGAYKPTGLTRTYPHYLTQEGVMGAEYNKWSGRVTPTHNVTLPYTRMLLGPMDYTPGGFRNQRPESFEIRNTLPNVMTTRGQALAMFVVYESPLQFLADTPDVYEENRSDFEFVRDTPVSWDETVFLSGEPGESIVLARRKGRDWWIGAMTNEEGRTVRVPLSFLGAGAWTADVRTDGAEPTQTVAERRAVTARTTLSLKLAPAGGAAVRLTPAG